MPNTHKNYKGPRIDENGKPKCASDTSGPSKRNPDAVKRKCRNNPILGGAVCRKHGGGAPQVKAKAEQRVRDMLADAIDPDRAMRETAAIAFANVEGIFTDSGNLRPMSEWPKELLAAVASVEVVKRNIYPDDDKIDDVIKVRFWDKPKAVEMLMKHHGKLKESVEHTGALEISWKNSE